MVHNDCLQKTGFDVVFGHQTAPMRIRDSSTFGARGMSIIE